MPAPSAGGSRVPSSPPTYTDGAEREQRAAAEWRDGIPATLDGTDDGSEGTPRVHP